MTVCRKHNTWPHCCVIEGDDWWWWWQQQQLRCSNHFAKWSAICVCVDVIDLNASSLMCDPCIYTIVHIPCQMKWNDLSRSNPFMSCHISNVCYVCASFSQYRMCAVSRLVWWFCFRWSWIAIIPGGCPLLLHLLRLLSCSFSSVLVVVLRNQRCLLQKSNEQSN